MTQPCHQELKFVSLIVVAAIVLVVGEQYAEHLGRNTTTSKPLSMADETWNPTFSCYVTNATGERLHLTCVRSPVFKSASNGELE
jgi:hypothetical protein